MGSGGDIIQDSTPQETSAHLTTYAEALVEVGALAKTDPGTPQPGDFVEATDPVWLVRLKGMFHHPVPPAFPEPEAACFELITLVDDRTGLVFMETLPPAEGCS